MRLLHVIRLLPQLSAILQAQAQSLKGQDQLPKLQTIL